MLSKGKVQYLVLLKYFVCIFATSLFVPFSSFGYDAHMLDALVERGVLSEEEALNARKFSTEFHPAFATKANALKIIVYAQVRYMSIGQSFNGSLGKKSTTSNGASLRRQVWAFLANFDENTDFYLSINTATKEQLFDSAYLTRKVDGNFIKGKLRLGYYIPDFTMEDPSGAKIKTPDRSIINTYWGGKDSDTVNNALTRTANQCFGGNHLGVYWNGLMPFDERFFVNAAITNSKNAYWDSIGNGFDLAYWVSSGFATKTDDMSIKTGINFGYSSNLTSVYNEKTGKFQECESFGLATYLIMQLKNFFIETEAVVTTTEHNKIQSADSPIFSSKSGRTTPFGAFIALGYTFDIGEFGKLEPIVRYSYLNSNGAGVSESNVLYGVSSASGYYDVVNSIFLGANWYIQGNAIKLQVGFEHLYFSGNPADGADKSARTNVGIVQFQVMF